MGSDYQQPHWRVALISGTLIIFLLWCVLRKETEIDQYIEAVLEGKEYEPQAPPSEQEKPWPEPYAWVPEKILDSCSAGCLKMLVRRWWGETLEDGVSSTYCAAKDTWPSWKKRSEFFFRQKALYPEYAIHLNSLTPFCSNIPNIVQVSPEFCQLLYAR